MPVRVAVFIDGANVYRAFKTVFGWTRYSPLQLAAGLGGGGAVVRTAFYIAAVPQEMGADVYADQQRFLRRLRQQQELVAGRGGRHLLDGGGGAAGRRGGEQAARPRRGRGHSTSPAFVASCPRKLPIHPDRPGALR